jgi:hypothetical protein
MINNETNTVVPYCFITGVWYWINGSFAGMNTAQLIEAHESDIRHLEWKMGWRQARKDFKRKGFTKNSFVPGSQKFNGYRAYRQHLGVEAV